MTVPRAPIGYLITFRTYGTWLPGDARGSTRRNPGRYERKHRGQSVPLEDHARRKQVSDTYLLTSAGRTAVEDSIRDVCEHKGVSLSAVNARSNHVHVVVCGDFSPDRMMNAFKSWATRRLRDAALAAPESKVWARHGSTVKLFDNAQVLDAQRYTLEEQDGGRFDDTDGGST